MICADMAHQDEALTRPLNRPVGDEKDRYTEQSTLEGEPTPRRSAGASDVIE